MLACKNRRCTADLLDHCISKFIKVMTSNPPLLSFGHPEVHSLVDINGRMEPLLETSLLEVAVDALSVTSVILLVPYQSAHALYK